MIRTALFAAAGLIFAISVRAQTSGAIEGTVLDPTGAPVAGARLLIIATETSAERNASAAATGVYVAPALPPGAYRVQVRQPGFRSEIRDSIAVTAGRTVRVDFRLQLGETYESVVVSGATALISPSASDWGGSIESPRLESLPLNGRDLFDLAWQEPGAIVTTTSNHNLTAGLGTHVSVNGARPNQNSFRMDGIYVNDATASAPSSAGGRTLGLESIEELHLVTSPFPAEYGRAAGAVVTAVSKSGSNRLHGSAYDFLRNSALDAKNFFDPGQEKIPPLRKNQFGALLSGPLRRDRLFFLLNYEGVRETAGQTQRPITLTADARQGKVSGKSIAVSPAVRPYLDLYPLPNGRIFWDGTGELITEVLAPLREDFFAGKADAEASAKLRFSGRYSFDDADTSSPEPMRVYRFTSSSRYQFVHSEMQYVQSPATVQQFQAGFSRVRNEETADAEDVPAALSFIRGQPLGAIQVTGLTDIGGLRARLRPRRFALNDYQVQHQVIHRRSRHMLKFGAGFDRVQDNQLSDYTASGYYRFPSVEALLAGRPASADLQAPGSDTARGWRQNIISWFVQDEYRASPRFSLNFGLRYDMASTPVEVNGKVATLRDPWHDAQVQVGGPLYLNPSHRNFAPRLAIAWDPLGGGKTVVRAGAGLFYDLLGVRELVVAGLRMPPFYLRATVANPGFPDLMAAARASQPIYAPDGLEFAPSQPRVLQFQINVEHQSGPHTVFEAGYARTRGIHLPGQIGNINTPRPEIADGRVFFPDNAPRINPAFSQIGLRRMAFDSSYHALLASMRRKWSRGLRFRAKYTWAKSIDNASSAVFADFLNSDNMPMVFNYRLNRGLSDFDVRHGFAGDVSYELPRFGRSAVARAAGGWELQALAQAQSGTPFNPHVGFDRARLRPANGDQGQRPNLAAGAGGAVILGDPQQYFSPLAFSLPDAGFYGNLGRNTLAGPGLVMVSGAVHKNVWRTERHQVRLRVEVFDVLNHPNFQIPSDLDLFAANLQRLPGAGRITQTSTSSRQLQCAVRWAF